MSLSGYEATPAEELFEPAPETYRGAPEQKRAVWEALKSAGLDDHAAQFVKGFTGRAMSGLKIAVLDFKLGLERNSESISVDVSAKPGYANSGQISHDGAQESSGLATDMA